MKAMLRMARPGLECHDRHKPCMSLAGECKACHVRIEAQSTAKCIQVYQQTGLSSLQSSCHLHFGAGPPRACDDGGVVEGVADEEAALAHQRGQDDAVGGKPHAKGEGRLLAHKVCHLPLQLQVHWGGPCRRDLSVPSAAERKLAYTLALVSFGSEPSLDLPP